MAIRCVEHILFPTWFDLAFTFVICLKQEIQQALESFSNSLRKARKKAYIALSSFKGLAGIKQVG